MFVYAFLIFVREIDADGIYRYLSEIENSTKHITDSLSGETLDILTQV
jgi:hypothetical protein